MTFPPTVTEPLLACCSGLNSSALAASGFAASGFVAGVSSFACVGNDVRSTTRLATVSVSIFRRSVRIKHLSVRVVEIDQSMYHVHSREVVKWHWCAEFLRTEQDSKSLTSGLLTIIS